MQILSGQLGHQQHNEEVIVDSAAPAEPQNVVHPADDQETSAAPVPLRNNAKYKEYVASQRLYYDYGDALAALNEGSGMSQSGREMTLCNTYMRKKTGDYAMRFRCGYARLGGYQSQCPYTAYIYCGEDDTYTVSLPAMPHPTHPRMDPSADDKEKRVAMIDDIILDCVRKRATVDTTIRELLREGLLPETGVDDKFLAYVYRRRYKYNKTVDHGVPKCGDSTLEFEEFCLANSAIPGPEEGHKIFCLTHKFSDNAYFAYFSTRHLLEVGIGGVSAKDLVLGMDFTYKLAWVPYPVGLMVALRPPSRARLLAVGVFGPTLPSGLTPDCRWPEPKTTVTGSQTLRIFCFIHMWRNVERKARALLDDQSKASFKRGVFLLQRIGGHSLFAVGVDLFRQEWEEEEPVLWRYFSSQWLHRRVTWNRFCWEMNPFLGRHNNSLEALNAALRHRRIKQETKLSKLVEQLCVACRTYSTRTYEPAAEQSPSAQAPIPIPTRSQLLAAGRWCRSKSAQHIYYDKSKDRYVVVSSRLLRVCGDPGRGSELDTVVSEFLRKVDSDDSKQWSSWSEFAYLNTELRIVRRTTGDMPPVCSCPDAKFIFCRHALGVMLREGRCSQASVHQVQVAGSLPPGRPRYTRTTALQTDDSYIRRHLELPKQLGMGRSNREGDRLPHCAHPIQPNSSEPHDLRLAQSALDSLSSISISAEEFESSGDEDDPHRTIERELIEAAEKDDDGRPIVGDDIETDEYSSMLGEAEQPAKKQIRTRGRAKKSGENGINSNTNRETSSVLDYESMHQEWDSDDECESEESDGGDYGDDESESGDSDCEDGEDEGPPTQDDVSMRQELDSGDGCESERSDGGDYEDGEDEMSIPEHSVDVSPIEAQSPPFIATSNLWSPEQSSCSYRDVVRRKEPPLDWSGAGLALAAIPVDARATARSSLSSSSTPVFTRISNPDQS
ncbi:hypothetical protein FOZ60_011909 [Perkinsus olseni]|uniref:SWIM-type domain-containing protein n=1 Tax=Perkinsus olseni TaxID=32597 RepID=A0A7J6NCI7_PEROL|nr:hypothetical protein FOZ60_011909 [Perkinsus olseni]